VLRSPRLLLPLGTPDRYVVRVPDWRTDVAIADDVIEEVARILGYDQLPTSMLRGAIPTWAPQPLTELRERVRSLMADAGMQEIITYSLTDIETLAKVLEPEDLAANRPLRVANPMSREHEYARTTLRGPSSRRCPGIRRARRASPPSSKRAASTSPATGTFRRRPRPSVASSPAAALTAGDTRQATGPASTTPRAAWTCCSTDCASRCSTMRP
jgi:hypothetical protein